MLKTISNIDLVAKISPLVVNFVNVKTLAFPGNKTMQ